MVTPAQTPEGVFSILDTDLYKLTMQCAILKFYPTIPVTYHLTNRTADKKLNRKAYDWLLVQFDKLANITLSDEEFQFLEKTCPYLQHGNYLQYLRDFCFKPKEHIKTSFSGDEDAGDLTLDIEGLWLETILYEIPILALVSEAYFLFVDTDWDHNGQEEAAFEKGKRLFEGGCLVSEFGSRRRRDFLTQDLVMKGLVRASQSVQDGKGQGKLSGTSNVYFAMKYDLNPVGTVAHEWIMGIAATTGNYKDANLTALTNWVDCYGRGTLGIALTDTFGTEAFLEAFAKKIPDRLQDTGKEETFAQIFTGTRQDSGDPLEFLERMRKFYDEQGIDKKVIIYSDSLNVGKCLKYREETEKKGLASSFGVGTFFTNDFKTQSSGKASKPLNIVIKLSSANGHPAIKLSDDTDKNMGDQETVEKVKQEIHYADKHWDGADEKKRW